MTSTHIPTETVTEYRVTSRNESAAWAEIDLSALRHNIQSIREKLSDDTSLMAVVKSDAYGHGVVECGSVALESGAERLAVGYVEEAKSLRESGVRAPVLRIVPTIAEDDAALGTALKLEEVVIDYEHARWLNSVGESQGVTIPVHVKVDTGMGRLGIWWSVAAEAIGKIRQLRNLRVAGLMTHCPESEVSTPSFAREQIGRLQSVLERVECDPSDRLVVHLANSGGGLYLPEGHFDMVRAGIAMYGLSPRGPREPDEALKPVMSVKAPVLQVKDLPPGESVGYGRTIVMKEAGRIAVLPLGYADGCPRLVSNRAEVLLHGHRASVVGIVSMNLMAVDVSHLPQVRRGDIAVLIGSQGSESITAHEVARHAETIHYEIVTRIGQVCRRVYVS